MTAAIDITKEQRKTLIGLLRRFIPDVEVWAYGSRVKWTARPNSDLDLVAFTTPAQNPLVAELKEALAESDLPFLVDFHVWDEVPERFHEIIRKEYVIFQDAAVNQVKRETVCDYPITRVGDLADSISETHKMQKERLIFLNTSDILHGKFLHHTYSVVKDWPGQAKKSIRKDDILFSEIRPANGRWAFVENEADDYVVSTKLMVIRARKGGVFPKFLYQYLTSTEITSWLQHLAESRSGTFPQITFDEVASLELPLPPISEQKIIADIIGALNDKIELNRQMNTTLEAMARALFQSWFVDFDPVRAKLDGRQPTGLDAATAALFSAHFQESTLGHIPQGWDIMTIEELAERVAMGPFGSDIKVSTFVPDGIPVISGQHLRGTLLDDSEFNFVTEEHADRLKRSNVQRGDVIFTHAGSIGQVAYIPEMSRYERYIISQRQFYMRCNRSVMSPFYIASYFKTLEGQHRLLANTSSTGVPSISQPVTYLRQLKMIVPPPALLKVFDASVSAIHLKMAQNDQQSRTLATIRDALLPLLMSGKISVPNGQFPEESLV